MTEVVTSEVERSTYNPLYNLAGANPVFVDR